MYNFKPKILNVNTVLKSNNKIYCKNLLMFILFLESFSNNKININNVNISFYKKLKKLPSFLRAPNRYKKASVSLKLERYFLFLRFQFDILFKKDYFSFKTFLVLINFLNNSFNFFESSLIYMKSKKIIVKLPFNIFLLNYK